jgi:hypothetical protein
MILESSTGPQYTPENRETPEDINIRQSQDVIDELFHAIQTNKDISPEQWITLIQRFDSTGRFNFFVRIFEDTTIPN